MLSQDYILEREDNISPMLQVQIQRKKRPSAAHYVLIYKGLILMSQNGNLPISKYRITNRKAVLDLMIKNGFITPCHDKKRIVSEYFLHKDTKYYIIAPKGFEYIRAFEKLEGLFD